MKYFINYLYFSIFKGFLNVHVIFKIIQLSGIISDFVRTFLKIFPVVELTNLGGQNFYLGLNSIYFCHQRSNLTFQRWFFEFFHLKKGPN